MGVNKLIAILLAAVVLVGCQSPDPVKNASPELQRQYNAAFQDMLNSPGNVEVALNYAKVATKVGDLAGSVRRIVVDDDQLAVDAGAVVRREYRAHQFGQPVAFVVGGHHEGERGCCGDAGWQGMDSRAL